MSWRWGAVAIAILALALIAVSIQHFSMSPHSYREAVMQVLDDREITYDTVTVNTACPPSPHCFSSGTFIIPLTGYVTIAGPHPARGQIACPQRDAHGDWTNCVLSIPTFDIRNVPLPPLAHEAPRLEWLDRAWHAAQKWWNR